jgi:phosphoribosylaminoimidazole (AIR) synthetase
LLLLSASYSYAQEIPSRFKKDIIRAAKDQNGIIAIEAMERVLQNIGASNSLSELELRAIFDELGEAGSIQADRMVQLL